MNGRRWGAWFDSEHLVIKRRRLVPWAKAEIRRIPLTAVVGIRLASTSQARLRARITVRHGTEPGETKVYHANLTLETWLRAKSFMPDRSTTSTAQPDRPARRSTAALNRPALDAPSPPQPAQQQSGRSQEVPVENAPGESSAPVSSSAPEAARSSAPVIRTSDGKRLVWLWNRNGKIHASLSPVGNATKHRLTPAEIARLLLADPTKTMPAIRALTGMTDDKRALARLRRWQQQERVVTLNAAGHAARAAPTATPHPAGMNPDGSVRTVTGGLPGLGKRRR